MNPAGAIVLSGAGEGTRLTTVPQFKYGKISIQLKVRDMAAGHYGYFGFFSRQPWASDAVIGMLDGNQITLQVRRASGEVAQPCKTPEIIPDTWHTLTLDWKPNRVEMLWNGVSCGVMERAELIPDTSLSAVLDLVGKTTAFQADICSVTIEDDDTGAAPVVAPPVKPVVAIKPPVRRPADTQILSMPKPVAPTLKRDKQSLTIGNAFYEAQIGWKEGLRLDALKNRVSNVSCLVPGAYSEFFSMFSDGQALHSSDFQVTNITHSSKGGVAKIEVVAENKAKGWTVRFSLQADSSPEMRVGLQVVNEANEKRSATIYWPHVTSLQIGAKAEDNYYFFPWQGGWTNNIPYQLGAVYGNSTGMMQVFSLFNPSAGSSVYTYLKDQSGRSKTAIMRKDDDGQGKIPSYVPLYPQDQPEAGSLIAKSGTQFAFKPVPFTFNPKQTIASPELVVGVAPGDWHQPLSSYSRWAHTWLKDPGVPAWYRAQFEMAAVHDVGGNRGFYNGFVGDGKWVLADRAKSTDDMLEVAYWWQHIPLPEGTPKQAQILNRLAVGDYDYWKELGGLEQLRREISAAHQKGVRVNLYSTPRFVWHDSKVAKQNPDWVLINSNGEISQDWTVTIAGTTMRMDDMCYSVPGWRKYISETVGRIVRDTGCDGVFMDTMNDAKRCYNPKHQHPDSPSDMAEAMLKDYRAELKKANPQAVMTSEDVCSERLMQYIDGSLLKTFNGSETLYENFDLYGIHFARFYFPDIKYSEWGSNFESGARRAFFNGMGYCRGDLGDRNDPFTGKTILSSEQESYLQMTTRIMKEYVEAFDSRSAEPIVPTLVSGIYANKFPGRQVTVWTLYNRTNSDQDTDVISVPHRAGTTYVELLHGTKLNPLIKNGIATIKLPMKSGEVLAVAQRTAAFTPQKRGPIAPALQASAKN